MGAGAPFLSKLKRRGNVGTGSSYETHRSYGDVWAMR